MKKLLILFSLLIYATLGMAQTPAEIVANGDTITSTGDNGRVYVYDPIYSSIKLMRIKSFVETYGGDLRQSDSTELYVTPKQLRDSLEGLVRENDSTVLFVTPAQMNAAIAGVSGDSSSYTYTLLPTTEPSTPTEGMMYYRDSDNIALIYNGSSWDTLNVVGSGGASGSYTAGDGLTLTGSEFALGTPGTLTPSTANAVTATSHSHAINTQTSITDSDGYLPTSGAVVDYVADSAINPNDGINLTAVNFRLDETLKIENDTIKGDTSVLATQTDLLDKLEASNIIAGDNVTLDVTGNNVTINSSGGGGGSDTANTASFVITSEVENSTTSQWENLTGATIYYPFTSGNVGYLLNDSSAVITKQGIYHYEYSLTAYNSSASAIDNATVGTRITLNGSEIFGSVDLFLDDFKSGAYRHMSSTSKFLAKENDTLRAETYVSNTDIHFVTNAIADNQIGFKGDIRWVGYDSDNTAPTIASAELGTYNDSIVLVKWSEQLDTVPDLSTSDFTLTEDGTTFGINAVSLNVDSLFIALDSTGQNGSTYLLDVASSAVQDWSRNGNAVVTDSSVTNNFQVSAFSDNFDSYTSGELLSSESSDWNAGGTDGITCNGTAVYPNTTGEMAVLVNKTYNNDQEASARIITLSATSRGMCTLLRYTDMNNFYRYGVVGGTIGVFKRVAGVETQIAVDYTYDDDDVLSWEIEGTTIRCYKNGSANTNLTGGTGVFTDSDLSSGSIGIWGINNSPSIVIDEFSCDNL